MIGFDTALGSLLILVAICAIFWIALLVAWFIGDILKPWQARKNFMRRYQARKQWEKARAEHFPWPSPYNR